MNPPVPLDDASRVAALRRLGVLDQPPAADLEAITRLAVLVTGAAASAVNLVDADRQWTAAATGLARIELPRADAMCAVPVAVDEIVAVADASADPRFADGPLVTGVRGATRMYVGVPVHTVDGYPVGTLCVQDEQPGDLTERQLAGLRDLARQVEQLLEVRRQRVELADLLAQTGQVATHDPLTGLANRRLLTDRLEHAVARAQRTGRWPVVCYCDVDGFAELNDRYGATVGDAVLVAVGDRLRAGVRALDTVARVGDDEFAVLCEDTGADDVEAVADRLRAVLGLLPVDGIDAADEVSVSVGAVRAAAGARAATLLRAADRQRYERTAAAVSVPPQSSG